ncbi:9482_t:CDS:2, partial [Dentiscutata erythropus]
NYNLRNLEQRYQEWQEHQQTVVRTILNSLIDFPTTVLQDPNTVRTKEHPSGATNRQSTSTTRRDPSGFEFIDAKVRNCSLCKQARHNIMPILVQVEVVLNK